VIPRLGYHSDVAPVADVERGESCGDNLPEDSDTKKSRWLIVTGTAGLLALIFGVPAVLVPFVMLDVPERSRMKVVTLHQQTISTVERDFEKYTDYLKGRSFGRVAELPVDSHGWIELINPMGRKAPGGGPALLPEPDSHTGAVGLSGDQHEVRISLPAYRSLEPVTVTITNPEKASASLNP